MSHSISDQLVAEWIEKGHAVLDEKYWSIGMNVLRFDLETFIAAWSSVAVWTLSSLLMKAVSLAKH